MDTLDGTEMPSNEVWRLVAQAGIADRTLQYAKRALHVKSRKIGGAGWAMSLPENAREYMTEISYPIPSLNPMRLSESGAISSDFVRVVAEEISVIKLPPRDLSGNLHIKIGSYEFNADADFPMEKLAELLRGLEVESEC